MIEGPMQAAIKRANLAMETRPKVKDPYHHKQSDEEGGGCFNDVEHPGAPEPVVVNPGFPKKRSTGSRAGIKHRPGQRKRRYSLELKQRAVNMVKNEGLTEKQAGRLLGIPYTSIYGWVELEAKGELRASMGWEPSNGDVYMNPNPNWAPTGPHLTKVGREDIDNQLPLEQIVQEANALSQQWQGQKNPDVNPWAQNLGGAVPLPDSPQFNVCMDEYEQKMRDMQHDRDTHKLRTENMLLRRIIRDLLELQEL